MSKYILILLLYCCSLSEGLIAQTSFIKWIITPKDEGLGNLQYLDSTEVYFYSYARGYPGTGGYYESFFNYSNYYILADSSLATLDSTSLDTHGNYLLGGLGLLYETNNGIVLWGQALDSVTYDIQLYIAWLDNELNLVKDSIYGQNNSDDFQDGFFIDHEGNVVFFANHLGGKEEPQKTDIPTILWKFDPEGNEIAHKVDTIPFMLFLDGFDMVDKGRYQFQAHNAIALYDYNMEFDTSYYWFEQAFMTEGTKRIDESTYFLLGDYNSNIPPFYYEDLDLSFMVMDDEMNAANLQTFGALDTNETLPIMDFIGLDTLFIGGWKRVVPGPPNTWVSLFKTNLEGDVFFQKSFGGYGQYSLASLLATPDGGCIAACSYWDFYEDPDHQNGDIVILKFSSDGDLITSIPENTPPIIISDFIVSPNPGNNVLNISSAKDGLIVSLFDLAGKLVLEKRFNKSISINTDQLPKGIYFYKIFQKGVQLESGKWIKD